jgi:PTH2 family peptidyl-tRNA hydrolase
MDKDDELVMYLVFRADLKMGAGKVAAQAGHATQLVTESLLREYYSKKPDRGVLSRYVQWRNDGITKVALKVPDQRTFDELFRKLEDARLIVCKVTDEGRTEVAPGSDTCFAVEPQSRGYMRQFVGELPLL